VNEIKDRLACWLLGIGDNKRRQIDKSTRLNVWRKYIGNKFEDKCFCCKSRFIYFDDFEVGHKIPVSRGGDDNIDNLRPICRPCNLGMGDMPMDDYIKDYYPQSEKNDVDIRGYNNITDEDKKQLILNDFEEVIKKINLFIYEYELNDPSVAYWKEITSPKMYALFDNLYRHRDKLKEEYSSKKLLEYNKNILPDILDILFNCSIILGEANEDVNRAFTEFKIDSLDITSLKESVTVLIKLKSLIKWR
jgi:5-methylcytosine-specific restriction endonuclease McrA